MKNIISLMGAICCISIMSFKLLPKGYIDRPAIYALMAKPELSSINNQLNKLQKDTSVMNTGYKGALLMMKAGVVNGSFKKLRLFKEGKSILENAIKANASNTEFRLLRLMIQENAPPIVNYNNDIQEDSQLVQKGFKKLPGDVQKVIINYSKHSKALAKTNFVLNN